MPASCLYTKNYFAQNQLDNQIDNSDEKTDGNLKNQYRLMIARAI
jgi:hypothetical protein